MRRALYVAFLVLCSATHRSHYTGSSTSHVQELSDELDEKGVAYVAEELATLRQDAQQRNKKAFLTNVARDRFVDESTREGELGFKGKAKLGGVSVEFGGGSSKKTGGQGKSGAKFSMGMGGGQVGASVGGGKFGASLSIGGKGGKMGVKMPSGVKLPSGRKMPMQGGASLITMVPFGKHVERNPNQQYVLATGAQECQVCQGIIAEGYYMGPKFMDLCKANKDGAALEMCRAQERVLKSCPEFTNDWCYQDLGGTQALRSPCPSHLKCHYCLGLNPLYCMAQPKNKYW